MYTSKLTTQGTITLPVELRRKYGLKAGQVLTLEEMDTIVIHKVPNLDDVRARNKKHMTARTRRLHHTYKQGDGFAAHTHATYGKKKPPWLG